MEIVEFGGQLPDPRHHVDIACPSKHDVLSFNHAELITPPTKPFAKSSTPSIVT